jgi:hypothetical protein
MQASGETEIVSSLKQKDSMMTQIDSSLQPVSIKRVTKSFELESKRCNDVSPGCNDGRKKFKLGARRSNDERFAIKFIGPDMKIVL